MDIANVGSALSSVQGYDSLNSISAQASVMMLDNTLQMNESLSSSMIQMMENSVNPHIGGNFDMSV